MALSLTLKRLPFAISLLYIAISCCQAQQADPVQIVARAALCFDNRPVLNNCLTSMGVNVGGTNSSAQQNISTTSFCNGPCFGQMMLMTTCINGILSNFQFYNPGMMQGVQAIFQTACGQNGNNGQNSNNGVAANSNGGGSGGSANMVGASNYGNELAIPMYLSLWMPTLLVAILLL